MDRPLLSDAAVYPAEELLTVVLGRPAMKSQS
jgi:hypothetical protein